jgi:hypothetical protein
MAYAFEGYATAEFKGGSYSCAGGLPLDVIGYLPSFLPNTTSLQVGTAPQPRGACHDDGGASRMQVAVGHAAFEDLFPAACGHWW